MPIKEKAQTYARKHLARLARQQTKPNHEEPLVDQIKGLVGEIGKGAYQATPTTARHRVGSGAQFDKIVKKSKSLVKAAFNGVSQERDPKSEVELELIDDFKSKFTNTHIFKFRQKFKHIPIYGSSIIVEFDIDDQEANVRSSSVDSIDINIKPPLKDDLEYIKSFQLKEWIEKSIEKSEGCSLKELDLNPTLYYYYDHQEEKWRLVYITKLPKDKPGPEQDYIVDINEKKVIARLPWIRTLC